jgi:alkanesulfonate monooxygenase SsuD/methylene tetrahydromethanopterin reductase-like flavin-dependent oxidoreductase (luciferase family)
MWYGGGSLRSAQWAGANGMNFLTSNVVKAEGEAETWDFAGIQRTQIRAFREAHPDGDAARVSQGLVVIPTDSASAAQREKYAAYAAARSLRNGVPQGPGRLLFALDLVGSADQIAERLHAHEAFREVREVVFALPFSFAPEDYEQILSDIATKLGPALGWRPAERS